MNLVAACLAYVFVLEMHFLPGNSNHFLDFLASLSLLPSALIIVRSHPMSSETFLISSSSGRFHRRDRGTVPHLKNLHWSHFAPHCCQCCRACHFDLDGFEEQDGVDHHHLCWQFNCKLQVLHIRRMVLTSVQQIAAFVVPLLVIVGWM